LGFFLLFHKFISANPLFPKACFKSAMISFIPRLNRKNPLWNSSGYKYYLSSLSHS